MKNRIPVYNLEEANTGISINRMSDGYIEAQFKKLTQFHRNDFYMLVVLKSGTASFFIDHKKVDLETGAILFLYPGQIQRIHSISDSDGWVLFFDNKLMDEHARIVLEESSYYGAAVTISDAEKKWFFQILELVDATATINEKGFFKKLAMHSLLLPCIYRIASIYQARIELDNQGYSHRTLAIMKQFRKLLRENYIKVKHPADYADLMNLTLGYLNDTVKKVTGFTVSYYIQQQITKEAQRLLSYSDLSINEIADEMGFEDPKYFSRVFTKAAGVSPKAFREEYNMQIRE